MGVLVEHEDQAGQPGGRRRAGQDLRGGGGQRRQQLCGGGDVRPGDRLVDGGPAHARQGGRAQL